MEPAALRPSLVQAGDNDTVNPNRDSPNGVWERVLFASILGPVQYERMRSKIGVWEQGGGDASTAKAATGVWGKIRPISVCLWAGGRASSISALAVAGPPAFYLWQQQLN